MRPLCRILFVLTFVVLLAMPALAGRTLQRANGQRVYVPVYSHVYQGTKNRPYNLSALLSIRNVDPQKTITITSIRYYNDSGSIMKEYLEKPVTIPSMGTHGIHLPERDKHGGSGANFTVEWESAEKVIVPVIQAVMIGTASTQGISFVCDGVVIEER